jgi:hypothetical protein
MSIASNLGTALGTATAYIVHYMGKTPTPIAIVGAVYTNRHTIRKFAVKHALDKSCPDAIQNNLLDCLEYIE